MNIKMKKTVAGSPNGIDVIKYKEGEIYELPESLLKVFTDMGVVEEVKEEKPKMEQKAPENKMVSPDSNKDFKKKSKKDDDEDGED